MEPETSIGLATLQKRFAEAKLREHRLEDELKQAREAVKGLHDRLIEQMDLEGVKSVRVSTPIGALTIFGKTKRWVQKKEGVTPDQYMDALRQCPQLSDLVKETANSNSVNARIREMVDNDQVLPEAFAAVAELKEDRELGTRR